MFGMNCSAVVVVLGVLEVPPAHASPARALAIGPLLLSNSVDSSVWC